MGDHLLPGRERRRATRRSIRFTTAAILAVPLASLIAILALAGLAIGEALARGGPAPGRGPALVRIAIADVIGLVAVLVSVVAMAWFSRRLTRDIASLDATARRFAGQQLPQFVERLRRAGHVDPESELSAPAAARITEVVRAAEALATVQRTAVAATAAEASLRDGVSQVFVSLARRSQSLLQRQLRLLDDLERQAADPAALAELFPLDHLTTRMRRHAEGLIILSGAVPGRAWSSPVPVIDVIRGAIAEVEDYRRVRAVTTSDDTVAGSAAADMIHLLAELIENATLFSPSGTPVEVRAERVDAGFAIEVEDRGLGIKPEDLDAINERLGQPTDFDLADADQLGLFVVARLADRHGVRVFLRPSGYGGIAAIVVMPPSMVPTRAEAPAGAERGPGRAAAAPRDLQLALTGRRAPRVPPAADTVPAQIGGAPSPPRAGPREANPPGTSPPGTSPPGVSPPGVMPPGSLPAGGTHRGLPRRVRQASLSPHLRHGPSPGPSAPAGGPGARTPEQAQNLLASLQSGWERGRLAEMPDSGDIFGAEDPGSASPRRDDPPSTPRRGASSANYGATARDAPQEEE